MTSAFLKMPRLGETMDEGTIAAWMIDVGESFTRGQSILEIETDKTIVEFPALGGGILVDKLVQDGDVVNVGDPIGKIEFKDGNNWIAENPPEAAQPGVVAEDTQNEPKRNGVAENYSALIRATPVARKLARDNDLNLQDMRGTGRRGRIEAADVLAFSPGDNAGIQFRDGIAYVDSGPKNAPLALLIHGFAGDHSTFVGLENHLTRAGIRSISIDLPGHGATLSEAETTDDLAANLGDFVAHFAVGKELHIVAHSLGALPAVALCRNSEIASLTLIAPVGTGADIDVEFITTMGAPTSAAQVSEMMTRLTVSPSTLSDAAIGTHFKELSKGRLKALGNFIAEHESQTVDNRSALNHIAQKTRLRIIVGHQDQIIDWQNVLTLSPKIAVHHFADSGHMPHWDQRRDFNELLTEVILD